jgi:hypothetical protein
VTACCRNNILDISRPLPARVTEAYIRQVLACVIGYCADIGNGIIGSCLLNFNTECVKVCYFKNIVSALVADKLNIGYGYLLKTGMVIRRLALCLCLVYTY